MTEHLGPNALTEPLHVASGICWNLDQLKAEIEKHDQHNEMIELRVTHGFDPGKKCYRWIILSYAPPEQDGED